MRTDSPQRIQKARRADRSKPNTHPATANKIALNSDFSFNARPFEFVTGASFGSDRDFDKRNLFLTAELRPRFPGWVQTREFRAYGEGESADDLGLFGFGLTVGIGGEFGRSWQADNGVARNQARSQMVIVPDHNVARLSASVRAFLELGRFTLEVNDTGRWLLADEFVAHVREDDDHLELRTIDDGRNLFTVGRTRSEQKGIIRGFAYEHVSGFHVSPDTDYLIGSEEGAYFSQPGGQRQTGSHG